MPHLNIKRLKVWLLWIALALCAVVVMPNYSKRATDNALPAFTSPPSMARQLPTAALGFWDPIDGDCDTPEIELREGELFNIRERDGRRVFEVLGLKRATLNAAKYSTHRWIAEGSVLGTPPSLLGHHNSELIWDTQNPTRLLVKDAAYPAGQMLYKRCPQPRYEEPADSAYDAVIKFLHYNLTGQRFTGEHWPRYIKHVVHVDEHYEEPGYDTARLVKRYTLHPPFCRDGECRVRVDADYMALPYYLRLKPIGILILAHPQAMQSQIEFHAEQVNHSWKVIPPVPGLEASLQTVIGYSKTLDER